MLAYFPGGVIADHFSTRKLLALSLWTTALGGIYMAQIPDQFGLAILFAYWGITSILLLWAALISATREWGGESSQGKAFGLLDAGRGLTAAAVASLAVYFFTSALPINLENATLLQRTQALQIVIYVYTAITFLIGFFVWWLIPNDRTLKLNLTNRNLLTTSLSLSGIHKTLNQRVIWLQAIIVICAYSTYKGLDNYGLYAVQVLGMTEVESAQFTSLAAYIRPISAIAAGFLADRFITTRMVKISFLLLTISYALLTFLSPSASLLNIIYCNLIITFIAVYAVRGIYFALLEESKIANNITGSAVGLISVIGFTPDIFFYPIAGRLLDSAPGLQGHQNFFAMLVIISVVGMAATIFLTLRINNDE